MTKQIIACFCDNCHDTFEVTNDILGVSKEYSTTPFYSIAQIEKDMKASLAWWMNDKVCWNCGKVYRPFRNGRRMDEFVFKALKRTNGG